MHAEFWLVFYQVLLSSVVTPEARDRCRTTKVLVAFTLYVAAVQSMLDSHGRAYSGTTHEAICSLPFSAMVC